MDEDLARLMRGWDQCPDWAIRCQLIADRYLDLGDDVEASLWRCKPERYHKILRAIDRFVSYAERAVPAHYFIRHELEPVVAGVHLWAELSANEWQILPKVSVWIESCERPCRQANFLDPGRQANFLDPGRQANFLDPGDPGYRHEGVMRMVWWLSSMEREWNRRESKV